MFLPAPPGLGDPARWAGDAADAKSPEWNNGYALFDEPEGVIVTCLIRTYANTVLPPGMSPFLVNEHFSHGCYSVHRSF